jgi:Tol biopolymer transport system component
MRVGVVLMVAAQIAAPLAGQYFGQNKVRFKEMDFQVLKTEHFEIHYYSEEKEAAVMAGRMAERWYERLSTVLDHDLPKNQPVILYDSHPAFRATTVIPGDIGVGTGGVTEGLKRRVVLPFAGPLAETDHVLGHELVHAFQYHMTSGPNTALAGGVPAAAALPLWFIEGMAEYLSLGPVDAHTAMWLRDALQREKLPNLKQLDDPRYFPYRFGQAFWSYVAGKYGDKVVGQMLLAAGRARSPEGAIKSVLAVEPAALVEAWHTALRDAYEPVLNATRPAKAQSNPIIVAKEDENSLNVSPALSPDGKKMVLFTERDIFSIELFLADAVTGKIEKKLTESAVSPHFDSMEFIQSVGSWSPDGRQFAFPTVATGWPRLAIYDFEEGGIAREIELRSVGEIFNPTWSPDGRRIAFSAIVGGVTDLYVMDLESEQAEKLTNDAFADLQPVWSPSGRYLAFVTDRFGSDLEALSFARYRLGLMEVTSRQITPLPAFPTGKHIDPHWGADDNELYFVANRDGISNIYRMSIPEKSMAQLTTLQTGATGIAHLSPAISVAANGNRLVYSAFEAGNYSVYAIEGAELRSRNQQSNLSYNAVATLPPSSRTTNEVAALLERPTTGLRPASNFTRTNYDPKLSLDYFAPPNITAGTGTYGTFVGGGTALYWSDLLGQHNLMTAFQTFSTSDGNFVRNLGATATYLNQKSRWTWGFGGGQVPYWSGGYGQGVIDVDGQPVVVEESTTFWQIERQATGIAAYPFSRAMRFEVGGGFRSIDFAAERRIDAFLPGTGEFLGTESEDIPSPPAINLGTATAALVYDTSIFGGVSPVWGRSFRFEAGGNHGNLTFSTALADFRQYFRLPGNLTLAGRAMHFGRYGGGAEDQRLIDLYIGYPSLIRGYTVNSFSSDECGPTLQTTGVCPAFDQLLGSRMAVGNAELRVPILGVLGVIPSRGAPPVELAPFYDVGAAWRKDEPLRFAESGARDWVRSYGMTLRANALGFAIIQLSYVRPMDRPRGWHWEFAFQPGF